MEAIRHAGEDGPILRRTDRSGQLIERYAAPDSATHTRTNPAPIRAGALSSGTNTYPS
jgi:hypothetical protein